MTSNVKPPIECTALARGRERYVVLWRREHAAQLYRTLGLWAANPDLSFTWRDAAELTLRVRAYLQQEAKQ